MAWDDLHIQGMDIRKIKIINLSYIYTSITLYFHREDSFKVIVPVIAFHAFFTLNVMFLSNVLTWLIFPQNVILGYFHRAELLKKCFKIQHYPFNNFKQDNDKFIVI